jgi:hypothetical protein
MVTMKKHLIIFFVLLSVFNLQKQCAVGPEEEVMHEFVYIKSPAEEKVLEEQLFNAIERAAQKEVKDLIQKGVNVNARGPQRATPLILAAAAGDIDTVTLFLRAGADVNARDQFGQTALLRLLRKPWSSTDRQERVKPIVGALLLNGADPNIQSEPDYQTPLMWAAGWGMDDIVTILLEHGANTALKDNQGRTVNFYADDRIKEIIKKYEQSRSLYQRFRHWLRGLGV